MLTRIMAWLRPRRTLTELAAELDRRSARLDSLAAYIAAVYRQAGLPSPLAVTT